MRVKAYLIYLSLMGIGSHHCLAGSIIPAHLAGLEEVRLDVEAWAPTASLVRWSSFEEKARTTAVEILREAKVTIDDTAPAILRVKVSTERIHVHGQATDRVAAVLLLSLSEPMRLVRNPELPISDGGSGVDWLEYRLVVDPESELESHLESEFGNLLDTFAGDLKSARQLRPAAGH